MRFASILTIIPVIALLAAPVTAAVIRDLTDSMVSAWFSSEHPEETVEPVNSNPLSLIACTDPQFLGQCYTWKSREGHCVDLDESWLNKISAIDTQVPPQGGTQTCTLYSETSCEGTAKGFTNERIADLYPIGWDNVARSFMCEDAWSEPPSGER
ncbi:hypothetical protein ONS95_002997 [Cadophora gregata]|uniref:uncharacterized protein n=1 Tax=Cadophora gregata TaxID=51156 RepID=UPI0026DB8F25|nr:uncharacterized protein ONS95_002997 [Cadophora gregata]KAK0108175.1 hypothetical protein ONS95_002997 [Cadophora gregata]